MPLNVYFNDVFQEYVHWMTFWIVFSMVTVCEEVTDLVIGPWLPFYYVMKTAFLVWLVSPATKGSIIIYTKIVHPLLVRKEKEIEGISERLKEHTHDLIIM